MIQISAQQQLDFSSSDILGAFRVTFWGAASSFDGESSGLRSFVKFLFTISSGLLQTYLGASGTLTRGLYYPSQNSNLAHRTHESSRNRSDTLSFRTPFPLLGESDRFCFEPVEWESSYPLL